MLTDARAAGLRLDDAFREYLFERGTKSVPIAELTAVSNGASRVRLAAEAIVAMPPPSQTSPTLDTAGDVLTGSAAAAAGWFHQLADVLAVSKEPRPVLAAELPVRAESQVLDTFRENPGSLTSQAHAAQGRTLWSASLYVDDVTRLQTRLTSYVTVLNQPGHAGTPAEIGPDPALDDAVSAGQLHAGTAT